MKKILLTAAAFAMVGVSAIAVAPNTAQAIPAFARQTGAACYSCHFQSFPALADFGRSFKRDAFTDVGSEALIEDDNLSIPAVLNATLVLHANYNNMDIKQGGVDVGGKVTSPGFKNGTWSLPMEAPILIAGRVGKNVGAFGEYDGGGSNANGSPIANWQVMSSFDMGNFRMGLNAFNTSFGWTAGIETMSVYGQHAGVLNGNDVSAVANIGNGNDTNFFGGNQTQGLALWMGNDMWFLSVTGWAPDVFSVNGAASNVGFSLIPAIYGHLNMNFGGFDTMVGAGWSNGTAGGGSPTVGAFGGTSPAGTKIAGADMWFIDAQAQGAVGNTSIGLYADYAHTKAKDNVLINVFGADPEGQITGNAGVAGDKTDGWSIRATIKPIPQWMFEAGYGDTKAKHAGANTQDAHNRIWQIGGQYELYQNMNLKLMYEDEKIGGGYFAATTAPGNNDLKVKTTTFELEALM